MVKPQLPPDFKDFLKLCIDHEVRFLIVGGLAVVFHGHPRLTLDLDVWIDATIENGARVIDVLQSFGFENLEITAEDFTNPRQILRLGFEPTVIEVFSRIPGVVFAPCYNRKIEGKFSGLPVPFLSLEDLRTAKRASARPKDLQDLEELPDGIVNPADPLNPTGKPSR